MSRTKSPYTVAQSLRLWDEAQQLIPGGTQTNSKRPTAYAFGRYPIYAARAQGCRIWDVDGNEYIDYVNGMGPISLGHRFPAVEQAIRDQLERGIISGLLWPLEIEAAGALVEAIPCAEMVRFLKSGGDATAAAARIARAYTGRHVILNAGYRGWPDTWSARQDPAVPPALKGYVLPFRHRDLDQLSSLLDANRGKIAAVVMDVPYDDVLPADHLASVRDLTHAHDALLVMDEIVTGFRLARGGAHEYYGRERDGAGWRSEMPDLACFAKGLANGMPLAAVVGRKDVMEVVDRSVITVTYGGEALSLASCAATLRVYREQGVIEHLWAMGRRLMDGLDGAARDAGIPFRCSGYAPIFAMRLDLPPEQIAPAWQLFLAESAARGVLLRRGGLTFMTYSHHAADVDCTIDACAGAFRAMREAGYAASPAPSLSGVAALPEFVSSGRGQPIGGSF